MAEYHSFISKYLNDIDLSSFDCVSCCGANCTNRAHQAEIDKLYSPVITCLRSATTDRFGQSKSGQFIKKSVPGWNDFVLDAKKLPLMHTVSGACGINPSMVLFSTSCNSPVLDINMLSAFVMDMKTRFVLT